MKGEVVFDHVPLDIERTIIHDFSATAHAGQKELLLLDRLGLGEGNHCQSLMKFYELDKGSIRIDGVDTKDMKAFGSTRCLFLQDTWLFEGTIRENLIYNQTRHQWTNDRNSRVGIHHFIMTLPDTICLDDTVTLSVGPRNSSWPLLIALPKRCTLLILDEATSSVDTRELIQKAMDRLMEHLCHRPPLVNYS